MRGYFQEETQQFWLGGPRNRGENTIERISLYWATVQVAYCVAELVCLRLSDEDLKKMILTTTNQLNCQFSELKRKLGL